MTFVLAYSNGHSIMLLGDSGVNYGGGPMPLSKMPVPMKVQRSRNSQIAAALWGDLALAFKGNHYQPDLWLNNFLTTCIDANTSFDQASDRLKDSLRKASTTALDSRGGILLVGFTDGRPTGIEFSFSKKEGHVEIPDPRGVSSRELIESPIVRGLHFTGWADVQQCTSVGPLDTSNHRICVGAYRQALEKLVKQKHPVALPIRCAFIRFKQPLIRADLSSPNGGSFAPFFVA